MVRLLLASVLMLTGMMPQTTGPEKVDFETWFENKVLRIDFYHGVSAAKDEIFLDAIHEEPFFAGSRKRSVDDRNQGQYRYQLYSIPENRLIFSRQYGSLFKEWQSTEEAKAGARKVVEESVNCPFPKSKVKFVFMNRDGNGKFKEIFSAEIDPRSPDIIREKKYTHFTKGEIAVTGKPDEKVDLLFLAEGYAESEMAKYRSDVEKFVKVLWETSPYKEHKKSFNIRFIESYSPESGVDDPLKGTYRNSIFGSSYNTFGYDRYLTTFEYKTIKDVASNDYYDQIIILVNSSKYGGSGFFNFYSIFCSDIPSFDKVFIHELGHTFANLGDEYDGDFTDFYDISIEPVEANLTTQTDREKLKWKTFTDKNTPIPTPAEEPYLTVIGAFEGGGYTKKGIYRPAFDCRMRSNNDVEYCSVCNNAIVDAIKYYTDVSH